MKKVLGFLVLTIIISGFISTSMAGNATQYYLYIGAYTEGDEEGIYVYKFDAEEGDLDYIATAKGVKNPSYLAISKKKNLLFAVNETGEYKSEKSGYVTSFNINPENGQLSRINEVASGGGAPCYISLNKATNLALVANYSGGNVAVIPIGNDGKLNVVSDLVQHMGSKLENGEQQVPHAHFIDFDPNEKFICAVDLGIDKVISYRIDQKDRRLVANQELEEKSGAGPRHLAFHPNKKLAFVINELNSTVTSCTYNPKSGGLSQIMTLSTLPDDFSGKSYCADVHVSPDGRFLYGSNRGHNSIVVYEIDDKTGEITLVDHHDVKGAWPRNFMIDPSGKFLLVANQHTNNVVVFKIDKESGRLRSNGVEIQVNKPVCLKMMPIQ